MVYGLSVWLLEAYLNKCIFISMPEIGLGAYAYATERLCSAEAIQLGFRRGRKQALQGYGAGHGMRHLQEGK
jgi:hypothetical protein